MPVRMSETVCLPRPMNTVVARGARQVRVPAMLKREPLSTQAGSITRTGQSAFGQTHDDLFAGDLLVQPVRRLADCAAVVLTIDLKIGLLHQLLIDSVQKRLERVGDILAVGDG